jgi:hypothetical protein
MAAELRRKPGVAEDRRRWSFAEGGAARRSWKPHRPRVAVAGGPVGGGCGSGADLEQSGDWRWLRDGALLDYMYG